MYTFDVYMFDVYNMLHFSMLVHMVLWCRHVEVLESYEKDVFKCMDACAHTSYLFIRGSVVEQGYSRVYSDEEGSFQKTRSE